MLDIATSQHIDIDVAALSARLGCPVVPMVSTRADGIGVLKQMIDNHHINEQQALVNYPPLLLKEVATLSDAMPQTLPAVQRRWLALQMLEGDIYSHRLAGPAVALLPAPPGVATAAARRPGAGDRRRALPVYRRPVRRGQQLAAGDAQLPDRDAG